VQETGTPTSLQVVLADYEQNLNASVSPGEPKLWPYYMLWGSGYPSFHGQHLLKNDCSLRLAGVSRYFKMQDLDLLMLASRWLQPLQDGYAPSPYAPSPGGGAGPSAAEAASLLPAVASLFGNASGSGGPDVLDVHSRLWFRPVT
jgi:hypothetical protein